MTIHHLYGVPASQRPSRSGQPWADSDYEALLELCRDGVSLTDVCERLGRGSSAVLTRAKKLLPLDERGVPMDRVLAQLRTHLLADPDYDWARHLAATPPPRPVVNHVHPPSTLTGIGGLEHDELLAMAAALAHLKDVSDDALLERRCAVEVLRRGLQDDFVTAMRQEADRRATGFLGAAPYRDSAPDYWPREACDRWAQDEELDRW